MSNVDKPTTRVTFNSKKSRHFAAISMAFATSVVIIPGMTTYLLMLRTSLRFSA
ncbi:hypothetical protein [Parashewanella curva]|uniref:hypothetical protein n=1 Tax=Parashewanella curva TaxID=2338552 RepID=UPI001404EDE1|nr:hypothetical protein [Parashewanella curva]